jgi:ribonuclease HI
MEEITIFTDGGARGNPGPAALGVFITNKQNEVLAKIGKYLGVATNNVAEYAAIIEGVNWLVENMEAMQIEKADFYMDSLLAYSQLVGLFKIKNEKIREMVFEIRQKEVKLGFPIFYHHVPREKNKEADAMVNLALDNELYKI